MNSFERVRSVIRFQEVDRPPVIPELIAVTATMLGVPSNSYLHSGETMAECQIEARKRIGHDALFAIADLCVEAEALGCTTEFSENNYPHIKTPIINKFEDLGNLTLPDPFKAGRMPEIHKALRILKKKANGEVPVMAHTIGPISLASRIMDIEKMLYMMVDKPSQFAEVIAFCTELSTNFALSLVESGADGIMMLDPSASPALIPKKMFAQFEMEAVSKIFGAVKEHNGEVITWYSVAGPIQNTPQILTGVTADVTTIDYTVPIENVIGYSPLTVINGNIKPVLFLEGKPEDIRASADALLEATRGNERFILGSGCEVPLNSPQANIKEIANSAKRHASSFKNINDGRTGMVELNIYPHRFKVHVPKGTCLMDAIHKTDVRVTSYCSRNGSCGKCVVQDKKGNMPAPEKLESFMLKARNSSDNERLACHVRLNDSAEVYIPFTSRSSQGRITASDDMYKKSVEEEVSRYGRSVNITARKIPIEKPVQNSFNNSLESILTSRIAGYNINYHLLEKFMSYNSNGTQEVYAVLDERRKEVLDFSKSDELYGLAIDIGTTTISVYLHDMKTGEVVSVGYLENPQRKYGSDVITRTTMVSTDISLLPKMRALLINGVNDIIAQFQKDYEISPDQIVDTVVVGNPIIIHLFLSLNPEKLARSPFIPTVSRRIVMTAGYEGNRYKLNINPMGSIEILPSIKGFVGSDTIAGIIASDIHHAKEISMFIDIGTNGEVVIGNKDRLICTSVPAGPAFEGSSIMHGLHHQLGVISRIKIGSDGNTEFETMGNMHPVGLSGSSVIDAVAGLVQHGIIDARGNFTNKKQWPQLINNCFILVRKHNTSYFKPIFISRKDIEEIQKAKSTMRTAIDMLLDELGVSPGSIKKVYLSGSFGSALEIENAKIIGMLPKLPGAEFTYLKNSAGIGARVALLSHKAREETDRIAEMTDYINLAEHEDFMSIFIENMLFKETKQ